MPEINMPRLSDTMEDGVIATWRKKAGDKVSSGDVLVEIETDKAIMELDAYDDGILEQVLVGEGQRVPIGTPIGIIGDGSGTTASQSVPAPTQTDDVPAEPVVTTAQAEQKPSKIKASPLARKIARENGIDLATIDGSGPNGRIIRADLETATPVAPVPTTQVPPPATANEDTDEVALTNVQKIAARRLTESKQQAPHIYLTSAIDVTDLAAFRAELNETLVAAGKTKVSINDLVIKAAATALRANPSINVSFAGDKLLQHKRIHLGMAVAVDAGLVVPVIRDADRKSVSEIAKEGREKAGRARENKLRADEMTGGTFTISNLGMFGIEQFTAVINPPESAILAVGNAKDEARVVDGEFVARTMLRVTLSADHRVIDGATGAVFLQLLTELLEKPLRIIA